MWCAVDCLRPRDLDIHSVVVIYKQNRLVSNCRFYWLVAAGQQLATNISTSLSCNKSVDDFKPSCHQKAFASHAYSSWCRLLQDVNRLNCWNLRVFTIYTNEQIIPVCRVGVSLL